jgi:uncharacterized membrane protein YqaE (UPF0057 family)
MKPYFINFKSATMRKGICKLLAVVILATSVMTPAQSAVVVPVTEIVPKSGEPDPNTVKTALEEFNSLSRKERKARLKDAKKEYKAYKKEKRNGNEPSTNTLLLVILAILLPPLAVYLHQGEINSKFWISLLLTLLFWLPGVIYALIVILGNG